MSLRPPWPAIVGWLLIEVASTGFPLLQLPDGTLSEEYPK